MYIYIIYMSRYPTVLLLQGVTKLGAANKPSARNNPHFCEYMSSEVGRAAEVLPLTIYLYQYVYTYIVYIYLYSIYVYIYMYIYACVYMSMYLYVSRVNPI